ncbi:MAG TPA: class I SAM-dependent methyltransferase [Bryobacteraceae bacterium]|nr:class I SAM-dependent methyltransferase [Bryobacteraceae bacterium]
MLKREWEQNAISDPFWSILSMERFRTASIENSIDEFFQTGVEHVDYIVRLLNSEYGFTPRPDGVAVDFGCGVGRCSAALMRQFPTVVGYDLAEPMIKLAREHARAAYERVADRQDSSVDRQLELSSDPTVLDVYSGRADLVHSVIVFQHIPPDDGYQELTRLARCLRPGGCGFVHITLARRLSDVDLRVNRYAEGSLDISMFAYSADRLLNVLNEAGMTHVNSHIVPMGDHLWSANVTFRRPYANCLDIEAPAIHKRCHLISL